MITNRWTAVDRRGFLAAATAAGVLLAVTACGTGGGGAGGAGGATGAGGGDANAALTVWFPGNSAPEIELVTKRLVPEFEAANKAKVQVTFVDWAQMSPKLNAGFAGNSAPDVFGHGPAAAAGFAAAGRIEPLDDRIAALPAEDRTDLAPYLAGGRVDGTQYLIPLGGNGVLVAYRKDLLSEAGVTEPATWAEAAEAARKLTVREGGTIQRAGLMLQSAKIQRVQSFQGLIGSEGGTLLSQDGRKVTWNSPEGVKALEYFAGLYSGDARVSDQLGRDFANQPAGQNPLATGKAAMVSATAGQVLQMVKAVPGLASKIGVLPPLKAADAKTFGGATTGLFVNADSARKDLAWKFTAFMVSEGVNERYAEAVGGLPVRASAAQGAYVTGQPLLKPFIDAAPAYQGSPNVPAWVQVRDVLDKHLEEALAGKATAKKALDDAAAEAGPLLAAQ
ncbi:extracellular solute-binding protein [Streptosporangium longisporum]|uniref:ABC transporter substrate-binding protein n=1 Tax=Streptosporangium longisporum TaxID=46187 RepID=A0ABN3XS81_9ACTN